MFNFTVTGIDHPKFFISITLFFRDFDSVKYTYLYTENSTCDHAAPHNTGNGVADNVTGHVAELFKKKGMWDNMWSLLELLLLPV